MYIKKKFFLCVFLLLVSIGLFSCEKGSSVKTNNELYIITNPSTQSMTIFNKDGKTILRTERPGEEYLSIIKDEKTGKQLYLSNVISGEEKKTEFYEADGEKYSYDYPSRRVVIYDLKGKEIPLDVKIDNGIEYAIGDKLYYNVDGKRLCYDIKTKEVINPFKDAINTNPYLYDGHILCENEDGFSIYDREFKLVKDFKGRHIDDWSFTYHTDDKGITRYTFADKGNESMALLDENFNYIIEKMKYIGMLNDDYFTYMDGFEYGFMDYSGKKLYTFSIFDNMNDDNDRFNKWEYDYRKEEREKATHDNYPRVDGSTANIPMMAEIRSAFLHEDLTESKNKTEVTTTDYAWRNLLEGKCDLLLVYEPSSETKRIISESDVRLNVVPIGVDALVFIANEKNPIDNLKESQLVNIYSGVTKNWKDVGGEDKKIEAYQRPLNSGSQTLFLNLLMKDVKPVNAKKSYRMEGMDDLIEMLASYNNDGNALGYSVYYYAKKMYEVPGLKLLSVNNVEPNDETIANGKYPFLNEYYLVIREDTPEYSETKKLYNFILSEEGKAAIKRAGYIPR